MFRHESTMKFVLKIYFLLGCMLTYFCAVQPNVIQLTHALGTLKTKLIVLSRTLGSVGQAPLVLPVVLPDEEKMSKELAAKNFENISTWFKMPVFNHGKPVPDRELSYENSAKQYGYKTTNLIVLKFLTEQINKKLAEKKSPNRCAVPDFCAVRHNDNKAFLNHVSVPALDTLWARFCALQGAEKKTLVPGNLVILDTIRKNITQAFGDDRRIPGVLAQQFEYFLEKHKDSLLMVRSSGAEDRVDVANAGGNESVSSCLPTRTYVWQAMHTVISSYFSEKSLQQRLLTGDTITGSYMIPVLIQEMIGETESSIPVSGVIFSQEAEGNTFGIVQVQAAYGHNQGVVNSLVTVDTFYCGPSGIIHPVIRKKKQRLVSIKQERKRERERDYQLEFVTNNAKHQSQSCLTPDLVHDLKLIADHIQEAYNHPMDIEFVVQKNSIGVVTIYLVQARPLVPRKIKPGEEPSYIEQNIIDALREKEEKAGSSLVIKGITVGIGGGYVRTVSNLQQVLITDDIGQALKKYHDNPERTRIKSIIIQRMAPATSHEATMFRSYGLPVFVVSSQERKSIEKKFFATQGTVLIDPQRSLVVKSDRIFDEKRALEEKIVALGWVEHPIPLKQSLITGFSSEKTSEFSRNLKRYVDELTWSKIGHADHDDTKEPMRTLITQLKNAQSRPAVVSLLKRIVHRVAGLAGQLTHQPATSLLVQARMVSNFVMSSACEILYAWDTFDDEKNQFLSWLYPIKFLETLLFQTFDDEVLDDNSYFLMRKGYREDQAAFAQLEKSSEVQIKLMEKKNPELLEHFIQFKKLEVLALSSHVKTSWNDFLQQLMALSGSKAYNQRIKKLARLIKNLNDLKVLDIWLNVSCVPTWDTITTKKIRKEIKPGLCIELLTHEFDHDPVIRWAQEKESILAVWDKKIDKWAEPDNFEKLFKQFDEHVIKALITSPDNSCTKNFSRAGRLGKFIMLSFMKRCIDLYDQTIKGLTGSQRYENNKTLQVKRFAMLLHGYFNFMEQIMNLIPKSEQPKLMIIATRTGGLDWSFEKYIKTIQEIFERLKGPRALETYVWGRLEMKKPEALLQASKNFSVGAAQIGSKVDFNRATPGTLEDLFMLMHQNMLVSLSVLGKSEGLNKALFPPLVKTVGDVLEQIKINATEGVSGSIQHYETSLIGMNYQYPNFTAYYNLPLRQHSSTFEIRYNLQKSPDKVLLDVKYFGHNEGDRMNGVLGFAWLAAVASKLTFETVPYTTAAINKGSAETGFSWILDEKSPYADIKECLTRMGNATLNFAYSIPRMLFLIHKIRPFLVDQTPDKKYIKFFEEDDYLKDKEKAEKIMDVIPRMPDEVFIQSLYFNGWFIDGYMIAQRYDDAFKIIRFSCEKIIQESLFEADSRLSTQTLFELCCSELKAMLVNKIKISEIVDYITGLEAINTLSRDGRQLRAIMPLILTLHAIDKENKKVQQLVENIMQVAQTSLNDADFYTVTFIAKDFITHGVYDKNYIKNAENLAIDLLNTEKIYINYYKEKEPKFKYEQVKEIVMAMSEYSKKLSPDRADTKEAIKESLRNIRSQVLRINKGPDGAIIKSSGLQDALSGFLASIG